VGDRPAAGCRPVPHRNRHHKKPLQPPNPTRRCQGSYRVPLGRVVSRRPEGPRAIRSRRNSVFGRRWPLSECYSGSDALRTKKWERFLRLKEAKKARKAQPAETSQQYRLAKHLGPIRTNSSPPPFTTKEEPMETDAKGNETLPSFETWSIRVVRAETPPTSSSKSCRHHSQRKRRRKASLSSGRPHPLHQGKSKRIGQYLLMLYPAVWLGGGV
jgi:hypothetical protein